MNSPSWIREFSKERALMVESQLRAQGIQDEKVLAVMEELPRHRFLPEKFWHDAYRPGAVDIGEGQTISHPFIVARMTELLQLEGHERVLEIGTGSGYQAAILARLCHSVVSIERWRTLAETANEAMDQLGLANVELVVHDGTLGDPEGRIFDRIIVTAAAPRLPESLLAQLADPGRLVCPVGARELQVLQVLERKDGVDTLHRGVPCAFVPLVGREGYSN